MSASVHPLMIRLLSATVAAANRAGNIIRDVLKTGELAVVQKGCDDPQTEADRRAQRCIVASLSARFPQITIIGEESLSPSHQDQELATSEESEEVLRETCPPGLTDVQEKEVVVWVDPLDGTKEFTTGYIEDVTVLVGIAVNGQPVGGAINQPFYGSITQTSSGHLGRTVWGLVGLGVRGLSHVSPPSLEASKSLRVLTTRSHSTKMVQQTLEALSPTEVIRVGGCGNKMLLLLEGKADMYVFPSPGTKKWDTCAADAFIRELGGQMTDVHGRELSYEADPANMVNRHGIVASLSPSERHRELLGKIPDDVKKHFPI